MNLVAQFEAEAFGRRFTSKTNDSYRPLPT